MNTKRSRECKCKSFLQSKNNEPMITVVIPTNRFDCVNYLLHNSIYLYRGKLFSFEVHDSSIDDRIKKEVKNFISQNPCFPIRYFRYCKNISADQKAIKAIEAVKTQYFWLYGDGNLTDFNMMDSILHRNKFWDYNVIDLEILARKTHLNHDEKFNSDTIYEIPSLNEYIIKYFSHLTYWGAALVNTKFFQHAYDNGLVKKYANASIPWWIACIIFDLIAHDFVGGIADKMGVLYSDSLKLNPVKTDHWWTHDDRYYDYTFVLFNKGIEMMSGLYPDYIKRRVIINFRKDALVSLSYLVYLRSIGNLNFTKISKYKADIYRIPYFYYLMCIYCLIPIFLAKLIIFLKPFIKRAFFR